MAWSVIVFYAALVFWVGLMFWSFRTKRWLPFIILGVLMTITMNGRYIVEGVHTGAAYFVGIFDLPVNLTAIGGDPTAVVTRCAKNACSVSDSAYTDHASWAVTFYNRYSGTPVYRTSLLYGHIIFNTIALTLSTLLIFKPGTRFKYHKYIGRAALVSVVVSLICAGLLTSEYSGVKAYGASWAMWGLYFLSFCVLTPALFGLAAAVQGRAHAHRIWMWRFVGAIWGSYWIFRAEMLVVDLLIHNAQGWTLTIPSWTSGAIGFVIGDLIRRRLDRKSGLRATETPGEGRSSLLPGAA